MNLKYVDLYFEIIGNSDVKVNKEFFYYLKDEIEHYKSLNLRERQKYFRTIKNKKLYLEDKDITLDYSYIPTAVSIYSDSYFVYEYIKQINKCKTKDIDKILKSFIDKPLAIYNRKDIIIKYSLIKKTKEEHEKEVYDLIRKEKYLEGYLKHFRKRLNIEYQFDVNQYYDKYKDLIFREVIDCLKNNKLSEIIKENPYLTDYIVNFCFKYMSEVKYMVKIYPEIKKGILKIKESVLNNEEVLLPDTLKTNIDLINVLINDESLILELVNGNYNSIKDFCDKENIPVSIFQSLITSIQNYKPELYNNYVIVRENLRKQKYNYLVNHAKNILNLINNGVKVNENEVREFDNLDYFLMGNMDITTFKRIVESNSELREIRNSGGTNYNNFYRKYVNRNKYMTNLEKLNKQKKVIAGYEVTELDNIEVIDFFINNGIPLEESLVTIALSRKVKEKMDFNSFNGNVSSINDLLKDEEYVDVYVDGKEKKYLKK